MTKNILLLTSTIRPKENQPSLSLSSAEERLKDYRAALSFYSKVLDTGVLDGIVFADNSGFDLSELSREFSSNKIEWLSCYGLDYPSSYHRGYGEFNLVNFAFNSSRILASLADVDHVWKVTGRYIVRNIKNMIALSPSNFDIYCNVKRGWASMELMAWSPFAQRKFVAGLPERFATNKAPELILAELLVGDLPSMRMRLVLSYFWCPIIDGRRGTDGSSFQGRFTPYKNLLMLIGKLCFLPIRYFAHIRAGSQRELRSPD